MTPLFDDRLTTRDRAIWALHECGATTGEIASIRARDLFVDRKNEALSIRLRDEAEVATSSKRLTSVRLAGAHRRAMERYLESFEREQLGPGSAIFPGRAGRPMVAERVRQVLRRIKDLARGAA